MTTQTPLTDGLEPIIASLEAQLPGTAALRRVLARDRVAVALAGCGCCRFRQSCPCPGDVGCELRPGRGEN